MIQEKMMSRTVRTVFASSMLVGMTAMMHNAIAQEAAPQKIESVQITGTRITTPGTTSTSPITSVTAEEIKSSQPVAVEEFIKGVPAALPSIGPGTNNGTSGAATIDLRGLGANRTLVLINGRRMVPFNLNGTVDTNSIPIALLSRVDLLTGGASVAYGADAVAGVVNFNLKKNFTGIDIGTSYGGTANDHDAKKKRTDLTMGASLDDGRGNVVLSIGKTSVDPLTQGSRAYGVTSLSSTTGKPTGSGTAIPAVFQSIPAVKGGSNDLNDTYQIDPATGLLSKNVTLYNTNPLNYYQTGLDRTQATSLANYKVNDHVEAYAEVFYTSSKVSSTLAESGTFLNTYNVPIGNPYMPAGMRQQLCAQSNIPAANCVVGDPTLVSMQIGRRFVELGPRLNSFDNKTLQYTVGARGDLAWDWTYDASWTRGQADQTQVRGNWGSYAKVQQALNALNTTTCVNNANGCVPLNVFGAAGSITPAMLGFVNASAILNQSVTQDVASLSLAGDFGEKFVSPWAGTPISMAITAEERKVTAGTQSDAASQLQGEVLGSGAPTPDRSGHFSLRELAIESQIPLVKNKPFIRALNADLGYRETQFKSGDSSTNYSSWKVGGEWEPVKSFRIRAMLQQATRAPNVNELFAPQVTNLSNLATDPCQKDLIKQSEANTPGTLSNLCRLTGVPVEKIGSLVAPSSGQINNLTGGNPKLGPEVAKTKTLGFVWEPLPKLAVSVDYYKISINDAISSLSTSDVLDGCYDPKLNPTFALNSYCAVVGRDPSNGTFNGVGSKGVQTPLSNSGKQSTSGFDVGVNYKLQAKTLNLDPKYGNFDLSWNFTQVNSFLFQGSPNSVNRDCLGYYSIACGNVTNAPVYKRKFNQRTTWNVGDFAFGYNWRYVSAVDIEPLAQQAAKVKFLPQYSHIPAYSYVDLSGVYNYSKNLRFNLSVNNAANKKPPIVGGTIGTTTMDSGNTFPQSYDAVGRFVTFGANLKF